MSLCVTIDPTLLKDGDYVELMGRLNTTELRIRREGRTPELAAAELELLMAVGNRDAAIERAKEMLSAKRSDAAEAEARHALAFMGVPRDEWA